jgi:hypothetical protein
MSDYFFGYDPTIEPREELAKQCLDIDFAKLTASTADWQPRNIRKRMNKAGFPKNQRRQNSCAGFATCHAGTGCYMLQSGGGVREFFPPWTYKWARKRDRIQGDNGSTIHSVVMSGKEDGLLPVDYNRDNKPEFVYDDKNSELTFPSTAKEMAEKFQFKSSVELKSTEAVRNFIKGGFGAVIVGGPYSGIKPGPDGIIRRVRGGSGGHARVILDIEEINGEEFFSESGSWGDAYSLGGWVLYTNEAMDDQMNMDWFVAIGVTDLELDSEELKPRVPRFVKLF